MHERERYALAIIAAEAIYNLWELENQQEEPILEGMMRRLKDLSAYSLTHAEIMDQREGVELLALAMFFGATSDPRFYKNQERLSLLSEETFAYLGRAEVIEHAVARRKATASRQKMDSGAKSLQLSAHPRCCWRIWTRSASTVSFWSSTICMATKTIRS